MEGSEDGSGWERSFTSRHLSTPCLIPESTGSFDLASGGGGGAPSRAEEAEDDDNWSFKSHWKRARGAGTSGDVSLREWLGNPGRSVDFLECLHIFRQVVDTVSLAHSQSVVVTNIRPSCFVMSTFNRVSFIESASCSSSGSEASCEEDGAKIGPLPVERGLSGEEVEGRRGMSGLGGTKERNEFPLKQILLMEFQWYTSPEEAASGTSTFASDIYRLGVLLFELFCMFDSPAEKLGTMANLRHRVLPPQMLLKWPKVASFCLWLLHPLPSSRPKMSEVLESEFLNEERDSLEEREAAIKLREEIEDQELLLEFLLQLQERKKETAQKLQDTTCFLSADIEEVTSQMPKGGPCSQQDKDAHPAVEKEYWSLPLEDSACSVSRKRLKTGLLNYDEEECDRNHSVASKSEAHSEVQEKIQSKCSRLMKNFKKLEAAYMSSRFRVKKPAGKHLNRKFASINSARGSIMKADVSSVDDLATKQCTGGRKSEWINSFLEGLCKYLSFSTLKVRADLKQGDLLSSSNLVCSLAFDRDKEFFATAGVNRKVKIFECDMILNNCDIHYPVVEMANRSKLSSLCWNSYIKNQIASSDFDGVVQVWDVTRSQVLMEMKEHERRVWSVDFSLVDPTKLASGSDDGTVKLWNINQGGSIATLRTKANVCAVQFPPDSSYLLSLGSADHNVYCYDLRNLRVPWCILSGHSKTVSYVKFVDSTTLVSASTDNSLKLWDLPGGASRVLENPCQTYTGHTNIKNFVGLSISDGYIATGSETNEVFVYHKAFPMPVLSYKFNNTDPISGREIDDAAQFISSVCWRGQSSTLVAANSSGNIKILEMV